VVDQLATRLIVRHLYPVGGVRAEPLAEQGDVPLSARLVRRQVHQRSLCMVFILRM
jgi:hypothetical protein